MRTSRLLAICLMSTIAVASPASSERLEGAAAQRIIDNGEIIAAAHTSLLLWDVLVEFRGVIYSCHFSLNEGRPSICVTR